MNMIRCTEMFILSVSLVLVFLSSLCVAEGSYSMRCSNNTKTRTTLKPANDGVKARYIMEWCTDVTPTDIHWELLVSYDHDIRKRRSCKYTHTTKEITLDWTQPLNCSFVCLSTSLEMVFKSYYCIWNRFTERGTFKFISKHNITNEYKSEDFFNANVSGSSINHGDYTSVNFFLDTIPVVEFETTLCENPKKVLHGEDRCSFVTSNCSTPATPYEVVCRLRLPPGLYELTLIFMGGWQTSSFMKHASYTRLISVSGSAPAAVDEAMVGGGGAGVVWACSGAAALCALAALLLLALRCRRAQHFRKQVLRNWLHREESKQPATEEAPMGPVLLLYARECAAAEPIISALRELLETVAPGQVYDIYCPETLALAASGSGAWLRALLQRGDSRVVLLQTPALQALHTPRRASDSGPPRLEQPLLPERLVYRVPAAGDWLVSLALRLLADSAPAHLAPYRKYYLATLQGLETDALPYTVPFRRYALPLHAATLLRDLRAPAAKPAVLPAPAPAAPAAPAPHKLDELARGVTDFVDYARANPDYLMDELLIL